MLSFEDHLNAALRAAARAARQLTGPECRTPDQRRCGLCLGDTLSYDTEVTLKKQALQAFWESLRLGVPLNPLVTAGSGRNYRTVSKRKLFHTRKGAALGLIS